MDGGTWGICYGVLAVLACALYTIWIKVHGDDLGMSDAQLLLNQSGVGFCMLFPVCFFTDYDLVTCVIVDRPTYWPGKREFQEGRSKSIVRDSSLCKSCLWRDTQIFA